MHNPKTERWDRAGGLDVELAAVTPARESLGAGNAASNLLLIPLSTDSLCQGCQKRGIRSLSLARISQQLELQSEEGKMLLKISLNI